MRFRDTHRKSLKSAFNPKTVGNASLPFLYKKIMKDFYFSFDGEVSDQTVHWGIRPSVRFQVDTICPRSLDPFYVETYYISLVKTSWTYSITGIIPQEKIQEH